MVQASNTIPLRSRVSSGFQRDSLFEVNAKNRHGGRNAAVKIGQIQRPAKVFIDQARRELTPGTPAEAKRIRSI